MALRRPLALSWREDVEPGPHARSKVGREEVGTAGGRFLRRLHDDHLQIRLRPHRVPCQITGQVESLHAQTTKFRRDAKELRLQQLATLSREPEDQRHRR